MPGIEGQKVRRTKLWNQGDSTGAIVEKKEMQSYNVSSLTYYRVIHQQIGA
jgi:hypothetical protein